MHDSNELPDTQGSKCSLAKRSIITQHLKQTSSDPGREFYLVQLLPPSLPPHPSAPSFPITHKKQVLNNFAHLHIPLSLLSPTK